MCIRDRLSKYSDDINLNPKLFARVKAVYDKKDELGLDKEQMKLLEETYKDFVRGALIFPLRIRLNCVS